MSENPEEDSIHTYVFIDENPEVVCENMKTLEHNLNRIIARHWWQKYITAAFWSNMSTPVNLTIMLLTTLTTGQATTNNLLSNESFVSVSVASLILSVINTFFRPHAQMNDNLDIMRKWQSLGSKFERVFYSKNYDKEDYERRLKDYAKLQKDVHSLQNSPTPTNQNFFTDLIYYAVSLALVKKRRHLWINEDALPKSHKKQNTSVQTDNDKIESSIV